MRDALKNIFGILLTNHGNSVKILCVADQAEKLGPYKLRVWRNWQTR